MTSLIDAVMKENIRMLNMYLSGSRTSENEKNQALLIAVKRKSSECVKCLLNAGADKDITDASSNSLLITSTSSNDAKTTKVLLEAKCNPNIKGTGRCTPLHIAAKRGFDDCLEHLIDFGANVNSRDSSEATPLIHAVKNRGYFAIQRLLDEHCAVNAVDCDGRSALHYASQRAMGVELLLKAGADRNICDKENNTALLVASTEGFDKVVSLLSSKNCDVNIANRSSKKTPLHILSSKGHHACIEDLVLAGADVNLVDGNQLTPLWYATNNNRIAVVKLLLKANSQVDMSQCAKEAPSETCPVKLAFEKGFVTIIKLFMITGFDSVHIKQCLASESVIDDFQFELSEYFHHSKDVMPLRGLCRLWIRHHLGNMFYHDLKDLPVPDKIRQYLLLKELDHVN